MATTMISNYSVSVTYTTHIHGASVTILTPLSSMHYAFSAPALLKKRSNQYSGIPDTKNLLSLHPYMRLRGSPLQFVDMTLSSPTLLIVLSRHPGLEGNECHCQYHPTLKNQQCAK
jgi:hypothetical protein